MEYVFRLAETRRIVLVMDEYPYAARASKSLASTLQMLIDQNKDSSKLFLIICGSAMSFMENHVLAYKAPLYGRRTAQFKLLPFDFFEAKQCFEGFSPTDMATVYGIVGGTPQYLLQMDDSLPLEANIKRSFLDAAARCLRSRAICSSRSCASPPSTTPPSPPSRRAAAVCPKSPPRSGRRPELAPRI